MNQIDLSTTTVCSDLFAAWSRGYSIRKEGGDDDMRAHMGESPVLSMSSVEDWRVRVELMAFYLHVADRHAFASGGPAARDRLQERLVREVAENLVAVSFRGGDATFVEQMTNAVLREFYAAERDYGACSSLLDDTGRADGFPGDSSAGGRFLSNPGARSSPDFALLAYYSAVQGLVESNLIHRVQFEAGLLR